MKESPQSDSTSIPPNGAMVEQYIFSVRFSPPVGVFTDISGATVNFDDISGEGPHMVRCSASLPDGRSLPSEYRLGQLSTYPGSNGQVFEVYISSDHPNSAVILTFKLVNPSPVKFKP